MLYRIAAIFASLLILVTSSLTKADTRDYWLIDEFLERHPEQQSLSDQFSLQVRTTPSPIVRQLIRPVKISVVYPGEQVSDYWRRSIRSFEARMNELNIPYVMESVYTKPAVALREQAQHILKAMGDETDYLIFTLDARRHQDIIERIIAAGKPKLILQNITTPIKAWDERQPFMYVGFDHVEGTKLLADWYNRSVPDLNRYALVYWAKGYVSEVRGDSFIDLMKQGKGPTLVSAYYTDASRQNAFENASRILQESTDLNLIYACSTDVALGVSDAIRSYGKTGKILVNGWGGGSAELDALAEGQLDVTVMRMNDDNGVAMAEAIKLDVMGEAYKVPTIYSGDFAVVSKDTPKAEVEKLKARAFRYSGL